MSFTGLFGGGSAQATEQDNLKNSDGKEVIDGYEVANADDMEWLAGIL
ncbi:hypothetical protein PDN41_05335 [Bacillus cereus]|nr:hypothetical protein [Bacillus thuringiensis]EEM42399.1 hypothetical protein bthur0004_16700 [Bacillus thuringiensis serovar sotto str. T04001]KLA33114.1 hypothetical protein B4080_1689 [Bacillus cereus]MCU5084389.1 hypothetical protein [Bacillus cereus]MDA2381216.1 hypothetical protein [Bacillus cereus]